MNSNKKYLWVFPGMGKTYIADNRQIYDADCEQFKYLFPDKLPDNLHKTGEWQGLSRNPQYPENYFEYIKSVDAGIVLVNCHITLMERLEKEHVLLVYPSENLIPEYLERYKARGDNPSFVSYMAEEAKGIIEFINNSDYNKYQIIDPDTYLSDLLERNDFKMKLMNREELVNHLRRAMELKVIDTVFEKEKKPALVCDVKFAEASAEELSHRIRDPYVWATAIFEGKYELDIDQLISVCDKYEKILAAEDLKRERRGGLSHDELKDKIMQGIVNGALGIQYAQIAPYSHGYEVTFGGDGPVGSTHKFKNRWECYCSLFEIPEKIVSKIENDSQNNEVFGDKTKPLDIQELLRAVDEMEGKQIASFIPEKDTNFERHNYPYNIGSVASVMDVHAGKGLDGIIKHHYHGTYSTMTPSKQNSLVETLVCLKGFCLDCIDYLDISVHNDVIQYLKAHGTDISTSAKLKEWIKNNPDKCGKEENRIKRVSLEDKIQSAAVRSADSQTPDVVSHQHNAPER